MLLIKFSKEVIMGDIASAEAAVTLCVQYARPTCGNYGAFDYICTENRIFRKYVREKLPELAINRGNQER